MALRAGAVEDHLAMLLKLIQFRIGIRETRRACADRLGQLFDAGRGEERLLKSRQVVEHALRRLERNLRVREERAAGLLLERPEACVVLVAALPVRPIRVCAHNGNTRRARGPHGRLAVRARDSDVRDGHDRAPEIDGGFVRGLTRHRIDEPDVWGKRHHHANQSVLYEVREVARPVAVRAEVVCIHWPEERVVGVWTESAFRLQRSEPRLRRGGRKLESFGWHVAVGAGAAVAAEPVKVAVVEGETAAGHRVTGRVGAVKLRRGVRTWVLAEASTRPYDADKNN